MPEMVNAFDVELGEQLLKGLDVLDDELQAVNVTDVDATLLLPSVMVNLAWY